LKNRFIFSLLSLVLITTLALAACGTPAATSSAAPSSKPPAPTTAAAPIELKFAITSPSGIPMTIMLADLMKRVEDASKGRVKFTPSYAGALLKAPEMWAGVASGVADIGEVWNTQPEYKLSSFLNVPFLGIKDQKQSTDIFKQLMKTPAMQSEYKNVQPLYTMGYGYTCYVMTSKKQVTSVEDMKGLKVVIAQVTPELITLLGAAPVGVGFADWYTGFQSGLVDGFIGNPQSLAASRAIEMIKYFWVFPYPMTYNTEILIFNKDSWAKLPDDIKKIFQDQESWFNDTMWNTVTVKQETDIAAAAKAKGGVFTNMSDSDLKKIQDIVSAPSQAAWAKRWDSQGLQATDLLNQAKALASK
jgi:TRAP-type transport system periplasmic protein